MNLLIWKSYLIKASLLRAKPLRKKYGLGWLQLLFGDATKEFLWWGFPYNYKEYSNMGKLWNYLDCGVVCIRFNANWAQGPTVWGADSLHCLTHSTLNTVHGRQQPSRAVISISIGFLESQPKLFVFHLLKHRFYLMVLKILPSIACSCLIYMLLQSEGTTKHPRDGSVRDMPGESPVVIGYR